MTRRTPVNIRSNLGPRELYEPKVESKDYEVDWFYYQKRDKALLSITYLSENASLLLLYCKACFRHFWRSGFMAELCLIM
jgi:hypothetical protein